MLSKTDLQLIGELFDEKFDNRLSPVSKELKNLSDGFVALTHRVGNLELSMSRRFEEVKERIAGLPTRDEILQFKDDVITQLKINREENASLHLRMQRIEDRTY